MFNLFGWAKGYGPESIKSTRAERHIPAIVWAGMKECPNCRHPYTLILEDPCDAMLAGMNAGQYCSCCKRKPQKPDCKQCGEAL